MTTNTGIQTQDAKEILLTVLETIDFSEDKVAYADQFILNCKKQALLDCLQKVPFEKRLELTKRIEAEANEDRKKDLLVQYISEEIYLEALKNASQTAFTQFVNTLLPTLSQEQLTKLQAFFSAKEVNEQQ